jgi:4-amino-4-deoxy-L-arabinose transferase-like glycosyltransferase
MPFIKPFLGFYLRLTERSLITRAVVYGLTAFVIILGIDLIGHFGVRWGWFGERLSADILEATALAIIAAHLSRLREERILRRHRQVQYLNHHVRNALALLKMVEEQLDTKHAIAVQNAGHRIRAVIEQLSRDEDLSIDEQSPATYTKVA